MQKTAFTQPRNTPPGRSFSRTTHIGNVQTRVSLPGMKAPILFSGVPVKQHTRLPNHRPPLRRDKPVRIYLPNHAPRYIFPSTERSFIFIPRALRPNQQRFGRGRARGAFGSYGGFSSRRTSVYGGSIYSPSVAQSRRSSLAREVGRETIASPSGSVLSRPSEALIDSGKPVVRLPPGSQRHSAEGTPIHSVMLSGAGTPAVGVGQPQGYPLPQKPAFRENWAAQIPMHQPRPQKAVSVAGIESPASLTFHAPQQQEQQPFHQQVPLHMNGHPVPHDPSGNYSHSRQMSFQSQPSGGTPLSNIPERAIHAPTFLPGPYQQQPYQQLPQPPPQQQFSAPTAYYYQPASNVQPQYSSGMPPAPMVAPIFVQAPPQGAYMLPTLATNPPAQGAPTAVPQSNMVAHETNGMVYYYDPSQLYPPVDGYAPASYAVPGIGGMMTPSPDGYYYPQMPASGAMYYQPQ